MRRLTLLIGAISLFAQAALAQPAYPTRPIYLIAPHAAGATTDTLARILGASLAKSLGQPIVVENRPGANTIIGTNFVVHSAPDGYMLLLATAAGVAASPAGLTAKVPYNPLTDLTPITHVGSVNYVVLTSNRLPVKTLQDLIDYAKSKPGQLSYGSGNNGGIAYMEMIKKKTGMTAVHVPYKSPPQAITDLIGGSIDFMVSDLTSSIPLIINGQVKALAVTSSKRSSVLPDLPTLTEAGLPGIPDLPGWLAVYGPANLAEPIVARLNRDINEALKLPAVREWAQKVGVDIKGSSADELRAYTRSQLEEWRSLITEFKMAPD